MFNKFQIKFAQIFFQIRLELFQVFQICFLENIIHKIKNNIIINQNSFIMIRNNIFIIFEFFKKFKKFS